MIGDDVLPATVAAYLQDPAVRAAVDALLEVRASVLPPGLEWEELDTYYRARGGAELTRHDMAHLLRQLWKEIWGRQISSQWRPAPLEELVEAELAVTPNQIWEEKSFSVYHSRESSFLYTNVRLEPNALSIAFYIGDENDEDLLIDDSGPFLWRDDEIWPGWWVTQLECAPRGKLPYAASLLDAAELAYSAAEKAVAARRA